MCLVNKLLQYNTIFAAYHGTFEICTFLEKQNICFDGKVEFYYSESLTPFLMAVRNKKGLDMCKWLKEKGANIRAQVRHYKSFGCEEYEHEIYDGQNALHISEETDVCKWLLEMGLDCDDRDDRGETPLHSAVSYGVWTNLPKDYLSKCILLLETDKTSVHALNERKQTPLHKAADGADPDLDICTLLLDYGAEINLEDESGATALWIASEHEDRDGTKNISVKNVIALLSRGAVPGKLATEIFFEKKENNIAYFGQTRFIEKEEEETDKNGSDLIPYLKYFVHFGLYYLGAKYGTEEMLTSYLELRIFNQSKEVLFKAFAIYYDSSLLECVYSLNKSKSRTVNLHVWKFIKELKKDHWSSGNTFNDKENILFAEIEHCFTKGKANNKTVIQYAWINEKCEVNNATNKSDTCNCEKITQFIFEEICQHVMKIQDTFKKHCDEQNIAINADKLAIASLFYSGEGSRWVCSNESKPEYQLSGSEEEEQIENETENSTVEDKEADPNVTDMEHSDI